MICIRARLVSGSGHDGFPSNTSVAALLFVQAQDLSVAENIAGRELAMQGWAEMETERAKTVTDYSQFSNRGDVVGQAFREAVECGFGHVIYPESDA
jgi:hypothetical protein